MVPTFTDARRVIVQREQPLDLVRQLEDGAGPGRRIEAGVRGPPSHDDREFANRLAGGLQVPLGTEGRLEHKGAGGAPGQPHDRSPGLVAAGLLVGRDHRHGRRGQVGTCRLERRAARRSSARSRPSCRTRLARAPDPRPPSPACVRPCPPATRCRSDRRGVAAAARAGADAARRAAGPPTGQPARGASAGRARSNSAGEQPGQRDRRCDSGAARATRRRPSARSAVISPVRTRNQRRVRGHHGTSRLPGEVDRERERAVSRTRGVAPGAM